MGTLELNWRIADFKVDTRYIDEGWINFAATVWVYWGDAGSSSDCFQVRHTAYLEDGKLVRATDAMDHARFNSDLRAGLGVLADPMKDDIEDCLLELAAQALAEDLA